MDNKNLIESKQEGIFSKIKNWFKNIFGGNKKKETTTAELEFEKQENVRDDSEIINDEIMQSDKLQYEFSNQTVSKQKIEKIRLDLDNGKIGIENLYVLSNDEIQELDKAYDEQIRDTVSKIYEIDVGINNCKRRLSKIQNQN